MFYMAVKIYILYKFWLAHTLSGMECYAHKKNLVSSANETYWYALIRKSDGGRRPHNVAGKSEGDPDFQVQCERWQKLSTLFKKYPKIFDMTTSSLCEWYVISHRPNYRAVSQYGQKHPSLALHSGAATSRSIINVVFHASLQ